MKAKILAALREAEGYVSGQELCERFGVSRTAVWKAINQLKKDGYEIAEPGLPDCRRTGYLKRK